jgi:hypothetical protein
MNEKLTAICHGRGMTSIARVDHAPHVPALRPARESHPVAVHFGAAVSQKQAGESFRVEPAAVSDRKRAPESTRSRDPPGREPPSRETAGADHAQKHAASARKRVDLKA